MIHVFSSRPSNGAVELASALRELGLNARRRRTNGSRRVCRQDWVINWGESFRPLVGPEFKVLNPYFPQDKYVELRLTGQQLMTRLGMLATCRDCAAFRRCWRS